MTRYTIERHPHGWLVIGSVPLDDFVRFLKSMPEGSGLDCGIAWHYRANTCIIESDEAGKKWEAEIEQKIRDLPAAERWLSGLHVGISSRTMFAALADSTALMAESGRGQFTPDTPYDAADFGRCFGLLEMMPEWRSKLSRVSDKHPEWRLLIDNWSELETLYKEGQVFPERLSDLSKRIKALLQAVKP